MAFRTRRPRKSLKARKRTTRRKRVLRRPKYIRPQPNCHYAKLRYADSIILNSAAGTVDKHIFSANGVYDPDITGVGHQPMGFDELAARYQDYTVDSATITCRYTSASASTDVGASHVGIMLEDDTVTSTSYNTLVEQKRGVNGLVNVMGTRSTVLKKHFDLRKFFCDKNKTPNDKYSSSVVTMPAEQAFFILWQSGIDTVEDASGIYVDVMIEYNVKFTEPKTLAGS